MPLAMQFKHNPDDERMCLSLQNNWQVEVYAVSGEMALSSKRHGMAWRGMERQIALQTQFLI
jgi:hypothetical protein